MSTFVGGGIPGSADGTGTAATFFGPTRLTSDGAGHLYIAEIAKIRVATLPGAVVTTLTGPVSGGGYMDGPVASAKFNDINGLAADSENLWLTDGSNHTIRRLTLATGTVSTFIGSRASQIVTPGPLPATINVPYGIALLPNGDLVISDHEEHAILRAE